MKRSLTVVLVVSLAGSLTTLACDQVNTVEMVVSPNVLNLKSNGGVVTLHVDIKFSPDYDLVLEVNDQSLLIASTFDDSSGELVIQCSLETVKGLVVVGDATFDLTIDDMYTGTDTIHVIDQG